MCTRTEPQTHTCDEYFRQFCLANAAKHAPLVLHNTRRITHCIVFIIYCIFLDFVLFFQFQNFPFLNSICSSGGSISMCVCRFLQFFQFSENSSNIWNAQRREEEEVKKTKYSQFWSHQLPIRCVLVIFQMNFLSNFSQVFNVNVFEKLRTISQLEMEKFESAESDCWLIC